MIKRFDLTTLDKSKTYLVGYSAGPDSETLLHYLADEGFNHLVICYVDYHDQEDSNHERAVVIANAKKYQYPLYIKDVYKSDCVGNFESWARMIRYEFFKFQGMQNKTNSVFIAHQEDDLLETYLMQLRRKSSVTYYGIKNISLISGMYIIRPLLFMSREEILSYVKRWNLNVHVDKTNSNITRQRNNLRLNYVYGLARKERDLLEEEINTKNELLSSLDSLINDMLTDDRINLLQYRKFDRPAKERFMYSLIKKHFPYEQNKLIVKLMKECLYFIDGSLKSGYIYLNNNLYLYKDHISFFISSFIVKKNYSYVISKPSIIKVEEFELDLIKDGETMGIKSSDYPLTIRNVNKGDVLRFGTIHKPIRKILTNYKIPTYLRDVYPVIVSKTQEVIYFDLDNKHLIINKSYFNK